MLFTYLYVILIKRKIIFKKYKSKCNLRRSNKTNYIVLTNI